MLFGNLSFTEYILSLSRLRRISHRLDDCIIHIYYSLSNNKGRYQHCMTFWDNIQGSIPVIVFNLSDSD